MPASEFRERLRHVKTLEEIPDRRELYPVDLQLSEILLSPPPEHIHIVVHRVYSHYPFMSPILIDVPAPYVLPTCPFPFVRSLFNARPSRYATFFTFRT
jgi:hypothetical protein